MKTLYINTSERTKAIVQIKEDNTVRENIIEEVGFRKSQVTLPMIEKSFKQSGLKPHQIDTIEVERGPGSFTGLRVGISIANALAFCLQRSINNKLVGEIEMAEY